MTLKHALLVVLLVDVLLLWPFVYVNGYGHGDLDGMHTALFMPPGTVLTYGQDFSFGWYWVARLMKAIFAPSSDHYPALINSVSVLGATVGDLFLVATLATAVPVSTALCATLLWQLTPEVWEVNTYAHPWTLALPFFFAGAWSAAIAADSGAPRRNWTLAAILFAAAFAIRIDLIFFVPLLLVADYVRRRRPPVVLTASIVAATMLLFAAQRVAAGREMTSTVLSSFWQELSVHSVAANFGVFVYGGGLGTLLLLALAIPRYAAQANRRRGLWLLAFALLPTAIWLGGSAGPARHFGAVYLAASVLAALLLAERVRGVALAASIAALVMANAVLDEGAFYLARHAPARAVQLGVRRRVMERVPLGNMWSNHRAKAQLNDLDAAYSSWALGCATGAVPMVFAQGPSYRLRVAALARFSGVEAASAADDQVLHFGATGSGFWLVRLPELADLSWWARLQDFAAARGAAAVLLGPRIPGALAEPWQTTHGGQAVVVGAETPETVAAQPCPTRADHAVPISAAASR